EAPPIAEAKFALDDVQTLLRGAPRGTFLFGRNGVGFKAPVLDEFTRNRLNGMCAMLSFYTTSGTSTYGRWGESAKMAALALGRGAHCARTLAALARRYIIDREIENLNPYGQWNHSMLADEDLADDIRLYLQSLGKDITAKKLCDYLRDPEVRQKHGIDREISHKTACRYLDELGYRFTAPKKGQYVDGHERPDVVYHRDHVYLPRLFELERRAWIYDDDGNRLPTPPSAPGRRVVIWYHDESIFYAHDRRGRAWYHKDAPATPYRKGDGPSYMVGDFFSADFGWLRDP
ncbi:hypothetical protein GGX14DRAFT_318243, partial [Mycena pura]